MGLFSTFKYILQHPLNESAKWAAVKRYMRWQLGSRLALGPTQVPFVNETCLVASPGMTGATQNIYTGLHEMAECSFLLHLLGPTDLFMDVGSNVGVYTVLASGARGAESVAIEPIPTTYAKLRMNVLANNLEQRVKSFNVGLGRTSGTLRFTSDLDTVNHVVTEPEVGDNIVEVPVRTLDEVLAGAIPILIKIDVEGWESEVLAGAQSVLGQPGLKAFIVEMDGAHEQMNANEQAVHAILTQHAFRPCAYEPRGRRLMFLEAKNRAAANTIYVRDADVVQDRLSAAPAFRVNGHSI